MEYSFYLCYLYGEIYVTNDSKGCALIMFPDKEKTTLKTIWLGIKFIISGMELVNIGKALKREKSIKTIHPKKPIYYLWFIGGGCCSSKQRLRQRITPFSGQKQSILLLIFYYNLHDSCYTLKCQSSFTS